MFCKISLIKQQEIIPPQGVTLLNSGETSCVYLENLNPVDLVWRKKRQRLLEKHVIIGRKFQLYNFSSEIAVCRGLIFTVQPSHNMFDTPLIIKTNHDTNYFQGLVSDLFNREGFNINAITDLESNMHKFLESAFKQRGEGNDLPGQTEKLAGNIDPRLIKINRYIRQNYAKPLTLQHLSEIVHSNPIYLSNSYSKVFNIPPIKYLQNIKMKKAKEMIFETRLSIKEIANYLGYVSSSQFTNLFKRYYNISPTEMRKKFVLSNSAFTDSQNKILIHSSD
ncbi:Bifunctional transcriptional activator/DNA repair enzyme AdaA [compost metagenome]